ncbi:alcohol dehydrogenase catalytic domain-containing protein [Rhodococcus sp. 077-4]|uniref:alcohol dehydrogenase catalytic domain-containing protein n=1 Tax=Rhodococcus sp. 077-4 TaxID=2789271 RepID=UPI0039F4BC3E
MAVISGNDEAAVLHGPRDLRIEQIERATVGPGQVRVDIHGVSLCGSDLHYYADGRNGTNSLTQPTVLGHEGFGVITEVGSGVSSDRLGERVAIEPAIPDGNTPLSLSGHYNVCPSVLCFGSPPNHGLLRGSVVLAAPFAHPLPDSVGDDVAALIEPLAVAAWAVARVGSVLGKRIAITGAGPIGLLVLQTVVALGASTTTITDVAPSRLAVASALGATHTLRSGEDALPEAAFDIAFDCSGHPGAIADAARSLGPAGILALVGVPGRAVADFPIGAVQRWELDIRGCFRYGPSAFVDALALAGSGRVDLAALVTSSYPLSEAAAALEAALTDPTQLKIVIDTTSQGPQ